MKKFIKEWLSFYRIILTVFVPIFAVVLLGTFLGSVLFNNIEYAKIFMVVFAFVVYPMVAVLFMDKFPPFKD